ncbi:hypothetical protein Tco_0099003 [Tanacetum coccineum]
MKFNVAGDAKPSRQILTPSPDSVNNSFFLFWKTKSTLPSSSNVVSKKVDDVVNNDKDNEVEDVSMKLPLIWLLRASMLIKLLKVAVVGEIKACMNNGRKIMVKTCMMMMTLMFD